MAKSESYISFISDLLKTGIVERKKVLAKFVKKWQVSDRTFDRAWKTAQEKHSDYINTLQKEKDIISTELEKESLKNGLKPKILRQLHLQSQIDKLQGILDKGKITIIVGKRTPKRVTIDMPPSEIAQLTKVIRELHSELSKMDGSYAPAKIDAEIRDLRPLFGDVDQLLEP